MEFFRAVPFTSPEETTRNIKSALANTKVVQLLSAPPEIDMKQFFEGLADSIGNYYDVNEDLETGGIQEGRWIDITYDPNVPNRYRSSNTRQPLHTDASYYPIDNNIQYFYCASHAYLGGATTFIDTKLIVESLLIDGREDLLNRLQQTPVHFSKFVRNKTKPILMKDGDDWRVNFNYYCLDKNISPEVKALADEFFEFLETRIQNAGLFTPVNLQKREAVFFHDEKVMHGRNAFFARTPAERSLIKGTIIEWENRLS